MATDFSSIAYSGKLYPEKEWKNVIDETMSHLIIILKMFGEIVGAVGYEAWLEVFRSKHPARAKNQEKRTLAKKLGCTRFTLWIARMRALEM